MIVGASALAAADRAVDDGAYRAIEPARATDPGRLRQAIGTSARRVLPTGAGRTARLLSVGLVGLLGSNSRPRDWLSAADMRGSQPMSLDGEVDSRS